ncbi:MAG: beta-ketoacyl-ACP synthase III [Candidatus Calescibacterium sp.]|nr:ketoacyl-ACP synthase III [Candidatus Calescibacterium sp.]MDW8194673.1 beta-ketoacyl-ACP synthase III [Candidatus Calescibacterium sp.]
MFGVEITGLGIYVPSRKITNFDLEKIMDTSDEWIYQRTGIKQRYVVENGISTSDLALAASKIALEEARRKGVKDIDYIILATNSPDYLIPSTSSVLQGKLGISAGTLDVFSGCTGFVYALIVASSLIKSNLSKNVLLVGAEAISKYLDWQDRTVSILLGDGAGAFVLSQTNDKDKGIIDSNVGTDGTLAELIYIPAGGTKKPFDKKSLEEREVYIKMQGREVFKKVVSILPTEIKKLLDKNGLKPNDVDLYIFHQANIRIINTVVETLEIDKSRVYNNIEKYANTSAASIPIAFYEAYMNGLVKPGSIVLFSGFGAGFTWANVLWKI